MRYILVKKGRNVAESDHLESIKDVMGDRMCMVHDTETGRDTIYIRKKPV